MDSRVDSDKILAYNKIFIIKIILIFLSFFPHSSCLKLNKNECVIFDLLLQEK